MSDRKPWNLDKIGGICHVCGADESPLVTTPILDEEAEPTRQLALCSDCLEDARLTLEHAIETEERQSDDD